MPDDSWMRSVHHDGSPYYVVGTQFQPGSTLRLRLRADREAPIERVFLRTTPNGASVCSFSLALNRSYKNSEGNWTEATDYIDIVAWGPLGERVAQAATNFSRIRKLRDRNWV